MKVSIVMPLYNHGAIVGESLESALNQDFEDKEVLVIDNASTDNSREEVKKYPVQLRCNQTNLGLAGNLDECIKHSTGEYIIILCSDDLFTNRMVVSDMVKMFEKNALLGVIGRYYYQFFDGHKGAVMTIRGDILTSSCQPSGIGFRRTAIQGHFSPHLFVEVPSMVDKIMNAGWEAEMIKYDTIAARLHLGKTKNTASDPTYYKPQIPQSPTMNWYALTGKPIGMYMGFIQVKNNAPQMLLNEIVLTAVLNPKCLLNIGFWFCALVALLTPRSILRPLSRWYRHRITRYFVRVIER